MAKIDVEMKRPLPNPLIADVTRRHFFQQSSLGLGIAALSSLLSNDTDAAPNLNSSGVTHWAPKAKRVIYLFQSGGPSQMDLFDYKPQMNSLFDRERGQQFCSVALKLGQVRTASLPEPVQEVQS